MASKYLRMGTRGHIKSAKHRPINTTSSLDGCTLRPPRKPKKQKAKIVTLEMVAVSLDKKRAEWNKVKAKILSPEFQKLDSATQKGWIDSAKKLRADVEHLDRKESRMSGYVGPRKEVSVNQGAARGWQEAK